MQHLLLIIAAMLVCSFDYSTSAPVLGLIGGGGTGIFDSIMGLLQKMFGGALGGSLAGLIGGLLRSIIPS
ncbi:Hypothetical protein NTJ_13005 [Nesidiocoris tenuis]|uniref:Uncharacterized protein n=1 Tax=Nesidiocoris tenuis TaxID=355587 RepID=A0ABN7B958_9HEMI|nr:Hypothetical protein NTJ_13005 [Nesidiocoris tenuis]